MGARATREARDEVSETTADAVPEVPTWLSELRRERRPTYRPEAYRFDELVLSLVKQP